MCVWGVSFSGVESCHIWATYEPVLLTCQRAGSQGVILCSCPYVTHAHLLVLLRDKNPDERVASRLTPRSPLLLFVSLSLIPSLTIATCDLRRRSVQDLPAAFPGETGQVRASPHLTSSCAVVTSRLMHRRRKEDIPRATSSGE